MKKALFSDFPFSEYERRFKKVRDLLQKKNLEALFLTHPYNLIYFSGYRSTTMFRPARPFICILPQDKDPIMITPDLERGNCEKTSWIEDIRDWGSHAISREEEPTTVVKRAFKELGLSASRVGAEFGQIVWMPNLVFGRLKAALKGVKFIDASDIIWKIRAVKSDEEIKRMRRACEITEKAIQAGWDILKKGLTERELAKKVQKTMIENGADRLGFLIIRSGKERMDMLNALPSDKEIRERDQVIMDLGAVYKWYNCDMTRNAFVGKPSQDTMKVYKVEMEAQQAAIETVGPEVKASEVDHAATKVIEEAGYGKWMLHRTGHSIGLDVHELPSLAPTDNTILKPGMIVTVEPGIYPLGDIGAFLIEDVVLITKSGRERLTKSSRELVIKD